MIPPPGLGILGPVAAWSVSGEIEVRGAKVRAMLALLCAESGRSVSVDRIRGALWIDGAAPATSTNAIQVYAATIRKILAQTDVAGAELESRDGGYRLRLPADALDRDRFLTAQADAAAALARGLRESAAAHFRTGLALWRGPALDGLADNPELAASAAELDRMEIAMFQAFAENEISLGRGSDILVPLERRAHRHPLQEPLWALLALTLYRANRQADALGAIRIVRGNLDRTLGVLPGDVIAELEVRILRQDPTLHEWTPPPPPGIDVPTTDLRSDIPRSPIVLEVGGRILTFAKQTVLLGRDHRCDAVLDESSVSARHARILTTAHGHVVEDLVSTNGTSLNGEPITRAVLADGDVIELGRQRVVYRSGHGDLDQLGHAAPDQIAAPRRHHT